MARMCEYADLYVSRPEDVQVYLSMGVQVIQG